MGISAGGMKKDQYYHLTYNFTLTLANTLFKLNSNMTFNYVSGTGTDSTEKGRMMWARVKGKTENDILSLVFKQAYMFHPCVIIPLDDIKPSSKL